jgi:hypothetical protein
MALKGGVNSTALSSIVKGRLKRDLDRGLTASDRVCLSAGAIPASGIFCARATYQR